MKKIHYIIYTLVACAVLFASCKDEETYADQKEKERKVVKAFLERNPLVLMGVGGDTLLNTSKINVISQQQFEAQDSMTDVSKNEYVLFANVGIYMQIVRKGPGERLKAGETAGLICRYWEYNMMSDTLQSTNRVPYWSTNPEILDASNNSGTISATFNTSINGGGAMYMMYNSTAVPEGWLVPLTYINVGRQKYEDEGIAKVRMIVPHSKGTSNAQLGVYPCFYEITYQRMPGR